MASLAELQSYQGNAALGAGGSGNVLPQKSDFENINRAGELWALQQVNANKNIFDQKIKDRDYKRKLFEEGQIKVGTHLDSDNPIITKAQKEVNDAYEKFVNAPPSDTKALQEYQNAHTKYSDIVTEAQSRYSTIHEQKQAIADEPNAAKKAEMQAHLDKQMSKGFGYNIDPYQKALDFNPNYAEDKLGGSEASFWTSPTITAKAQGTTTTPTGEVAPTATPQGKQTQTVTVDNKGKKTISTKTQSGVGQPVVSTESDYKTDPQTGRVFRKEPEKIFDYNSVIDKAAQIYSDPKSNDHEQFDDGVKMFENIPPYLQEGVVADIYSAINRYNQETQGVEGARKLDYDIYDVNNPPPPLTKEQMASGVKPKPILATKDANGKYHLNVSAPEYAALQVLAKQKAFKTGGYVFDEKATEDAEKRRKEDMDDATKRYIASLRHKEAEDRLGWDKEKHTEAERKAKTDVSDIVANYVNNVNPILETTTKPDGTTSKRTIMMVDAAGIPEGYKNIGGIVYPVIKKTNADKSVTETMGTKPIASPFLPIATTKAGPQYGFKVISKRSGQEIDWNDERFHKMYDNAKIGIGANGKKIPKYDGDYNTFVKEKILLNEDSGIEPVFEGRDKAGNKVYANMGSMFASSVLLNNHEKHESAIGGGIDKGGSSEEQSDGNDNVDVDAHP